MSSGSIELPASGGAAAGVSSVNTLTGAVTLAAGTNVTLTPVGNTVTIASSGLASPTWTSYNPFPIGNGAFGTVSGVTFYYMTLGKVVFVQGTFTAGTSAGVEARITIPTVSSANYGTLGSCGVWESNDGTGAQGQTVMVEASKLYVVFTRQTASANGLTKQNDSALTVSGDRMAMNFWYMID